MGIVGRRYIGGREKDLARLRTHHYTMCGTGIGGRGRGRGRGEVLFGCHGGKNCRRECSNCGGVGQWNCGVWWRRFDSQEGSLGGLGERKLWWSD